MSDSITLTGQTNGTVTLTGGSGGTLIFQGVSQGIKGDKGDQGDPATNLVTSVAGKTGAVSLTKDDVGLSNVDNTSDADKPVSTATQTALNAKANASDTVNLTGNQTVAGVKTFSSAPIAPSGTSIGGVLHLTGTGQPNGVVSASVGSIYIDTAVTNGASSWIKKSGTGSTGWSVLEGDTGWRSVKSLVDGAGGFTCDDIRLRRVNETVTFWMLNGGIATTGTILASMPTGFTPIENVVRELGITSNFEDRARVYIHSSNGMRIKRLAAGTLWMQGDFSTIAAWPTTLPGVSA